MTTRTASYWSYLILALLLFGLSALGGCVEQFGCSHDPHSNEFYGLNTEFVDEKKVTWVCSKVVRGFYPEGGHADGIAWIEKDRLNLPCPCPKPQDTTTKPETSK